MLGKPEPTQHKDIIMLQLKVAVCNTGVAPIIITRMTVQVAYRWWFSEHGGKAAVVVHCKSQLWNLGQLKHKDILQKENTS